MPSGDPAFISRHDRGTHCYGEDFRPTYGLGHEALEDIQAREEARRRRRAYEYDNSPRPKRARGRGGRR